MVLIDPQTENVIYSVLKETDYASNLKQGAYSQSGLAEVVDKVLANPAPGNIQVADFQLYHPAYQTPTSFMASPIYRGDKLIGILAVRLPNEQINTILS